MLLIFQFILSPTHNLKLKVNKLFLLLQHLLLIYVYLIFSVFLLHFNLVLVLVTLILSPHSLLLYTCIANPL